VSRFQVVVISCIVTIWTAQALSYSGPCKVYSFKGKLAKKSGETLFLGNPGSTNEVQISLPLQMQEVLEKKTGQPLELITPANKIAEFRYQASYDARITRTYPAVIDFTEKAVVETGEKCSK